MESIAPRTRSEPGSPIISGNRIPHARSHSISSFFPPFSHSIPSVFPPESSVSNGRLIARSSHSIPSVFQPDKSDTASSDSVHQYSPSHSIYAYGEKLGSQAIFKSIAPPNTSNPSEPMGTNIKMEEQNSQGRGIIEISVDVPTRERCNGGSKLCGKAACGFSDAGSNSKDAKERSASMRKLLMEVTLWVVLLSVEVVGGIKANSLELLSDAAHLISDVASFAISLFSIWAGGWEATPRQSYGFFRVEILGALVSMQLIWLLAGILVYEAIVRLIFDTGEVMGFEMFLVATLGLVVKIIKAFLLGHDHGHGHGHDEHGHGMTISAHHHHHHHHEEHPEDEHHHGHDDPAHHHGPGISHSHEMTISTHHHHHYDEHPEDEHQHGHEDPAHYHEDHTEPLLDKPENAPEQKKRNINVQGAYLHVLRGSIQSIGIMIGGAIIWYKPEWKIIDPICTLIFQVIELGTTTKKLQNIIEVLMESTPREIDATKLEKGLLEMEEVVAIHELHIWAIKVGKILLTCHAKIRPEANADMALDNVINYIRREYNISHVTIQIER